MSSQLTIFNGIKITMYFEYHNPPHFHASYGEFNCLVDIQDCCILEGFFPKRQLRYVLAWSEKYRDELMTAWLQCSEGITPTKIKRGDLIWV